MGKPRVGPIFRRKKFRKLGSVAIFRHRKRRQPSVGGLVHDGDEAYLAGYPVSGRKMAGFPRLDDFPGAEFSSRRRLDGFPTTESSSNPDFHPFFWREIAPAHGCRNFLRRNFGAEDGWKSFPVPGIGPIPRDIFLAEVVVQRFASNVQSLRFKGQSFRRREVSGSMPNNLRCTIGD